MLPWPPEEFAPILVSSAVVVLVLWFFGRYRDKLVGYVEGGDELWPSKAEKVGVVDTGYCDGGRAEKCLARGHGRYKHCVLTPGPYPKKPPVYSLENIHLPLPAILKAGEAAGLVALSASLADVTEYRTDELTKLRFLRARKGNVAAADAYYRKACAYREELDLNRLETHWNLEAYDKCFAPWYPRGGIIGHSKTGSIVGFERFGCCCFPELVKQLPLDVLLRLDACHVNRILAAFEEDSMRTGVPIIEATTLIMDLEGVGYDMCSMQVIQAFGKIIEGRDMLLPNCLKHIFIIRAPKVFSVLFSMAKHVVDATTREKVQMASSAEESLKLLQKYIPNESIPGYLGGGLNFHGDPFCQELLGDATMEVAPPDAVARLMAVIAGSDDSIPAVKERGCFDFFGCSQ